MVGPNDGKWDKRIVKWEPVGIERGFGATIVPRAIALEQLTKGQSIRRGG